MNEPTLFEYDWGQDNSPEDDTEITTTILYFSKEELVKFKALCKTGMRDMFGDDVLTKANISDFLLNTLNNLYGNNKINKENTD